MTAPFPEGTAAAADRRSSGRRWIAHLRWLGPVVLGILVWRAGPAAIVGAWRGTEAGWLLASAALNLAILSIKNVRWRRLMAAQRISFPFGRALRHYTIGAALGAWTPGRLGDFSKGIAVQRDTGAGMARAMSSVLADRVLDGAALGCCAVALAATPGAGPLRRAAPTGGPALLLAAAAAGLLVLGALFRREGVSSRLPAWMRETLDDLGRLGRAGWSSVIGLTLLATLVTFLQAFLVARALDLPVGFATVALTMSVASLASLLPVSVAGLGTREATVALMFTPHGVTMPQVIGFCLAHVAVTAGALAVAGAVIWMIPAGAPPPSRADSPGWTPGPRVP